MTKQEEIREGTEKIIKEWIISNYPMGSETFSDLVRKIQGFEVSQGVVIKVDGGNKNCRGCVGTGMIGGAGINDCCPDCNGTGKVFCVGYVATESLVGDA